MKNLTILIVKMGYKVMSLISIPIIKRKMGNCFLVGINGYTSFYPNEIRLDDQSPRVWITTLSVEDKTYNFLPNKQKMIRLDYEKNSFNVQFIGIDYLYPNEITYYYQLETNGSIIKRLALGNSQQVDFYATWGW